MCRSDSRQSCRGWNLKESRQVREWQEQAWWEGYWEGYRQERTEGRREGLEWCVRCALRFRFRAEVPRDLAAAITSLADMQELPRWFGASQTADSLDAFRAAVGREGPDRHGPPTCRE